MLAFGDPIQEPGCAWFVFVLLQNASRANQLGVLSLEKLSCFQGITVFEMQNLWKVNSEYPGTHTRGLLQLSDPKQTDHAALHNGVSPGGRNQRS